VSDQPLQLVTMATSSTSARLHRVHYIHKSLNKVQLRWFVDRKDDDVGGQLMVHLSIIDYYGNGDRAREWIRQKTARENVEDVFEIPSHLLTPGHRYEINVKLTSPDHSSTNDELEDGLMQVLDSKMLNFHLRKYLYIVCSLAHVLTELYFTVHS